MQPIGAAVVLVILEGGEVKISQLLECSQFFDVPWRKLVG